jgi:glycosyltransferase involved in cell wall biosynthesis
MSYAVENYMANHADVLRKDGNVELMSAEDLFERGFDRRGYISMFLEVFILSRYLKKHKVTHIVTVGLKCGMLAIPCIILSRVRMFHWFTGQTWSNHRKILQVSYWADKFIAACAYQVGCDSLSQQFFLKKNANIDALVPRLGSICGVTSLNRKQYERRRLKREKRGLVVGFMGRLTKDKGIDFIYDLAGYFYKKYPDSRLSFFICGPLDDFGGISQAEIDEFRHANNVHLKVGFTNHEDFFSEIDILIMPSLREGFNSVVLEAQSYGIPALVTNIYGLKESSLDGVSSLGFNIGDIVTAAKYLQWLCSDKAVLSSFSLNAIKYSEKFNERGHQDSLTGIYCEFIKG